MKILLVGGSGFIGKSFIHSFNNNKLKKFNINKIYIILKNTEILKNKLHNLKNIILIKADIGKIKKLPKTDIVIYLAESTNIEIYKKNKKIFEQYKKAIDNFFNIIKGFKNTKVLYCSSGAVYKKQKSKKKLDEKTDLRTYDNFLDYKSVYSRIKIYSENKIKQLGFYGVKSSIARCFSFIGVSLPMDRHYAIGNFFHDGFFNKYINVKASRSITRSYMYADDLVDWLIKIAKHSKLNCPIYNVGSDKPINVRDLAKKIGKIFKKPLKFKKSTNKEIDYYVPNIRKAKRELNLKINYNLIRSIYLTIKYLNAKIYWYCNTNI